MEVAQEQKKIVIDPQKLKNLIKPPQKKRIFMGLLLLTVVVLSVIMIGIWKISQPGLDQIHPGLSKICGAVVFFTAGIMILGVVNMTLAIEGLPFISALQKQMYDMIRVFFPLSVQLGKIFKISRRTLEGSFISVSNLLFSRRGIKVPGNRLLVLTPHCLQLSTCPHKITIDPNNCKRCGRCNIAGLLELADEYGFTFFVATGGTLARKVVIEKKPKVVLAIACERDLMSGIQDVYPLPAVGVLNSRPNGPCFNTKVDIDEIRKTLDQVVIKEDKKIEDKENFSKE